MHFIGLVNVANIGEGGLGVLGRDQLDWLEKDVKGLSASTPKLLGEFDILRSFFE